MTKTVTSQPSEWVDSYGYEYESAKDLLLRNKADTWRNRTIQSLYQSLYQSAHCKEYVQAWYEGYDQPLGPQHPEWPEWSRSEEHNLRRRNAELALATWRDTHSGFEKYDPARLA